MKIAVIGAGWAGLTAAVELTLGGHDATVFEASRAVGGRARAVNATLPDGNTTQLDNGQHILIGAYTETLRLMRQVGVNPIECLLRLPLTLKFPDGSGLQFPDWPSPLNALGGIVSARGWGLVDKLALLRLAAQWRLSGFNCDASLSVVELCKSLPAAVMQAMIEPLCVSALNTPAERASAQVFLRVMRDSLFGAKHDGVGSSDLLLPRVDLTTLFPQAACNWLTRHGTKLRLGARLERLQPAGHSPYQKREGWQVNGEAFDAVILAASSSESARALANIEYIASTLIASQIRQWVELARALRFEAITTVYAWGAQAVLARPMLALPGASIQSGGNRDSDPGEGAAPAQFVFDRGQLGGTPGLLAFVVSASNDERGELQAQVLAQAKRQLGLRLQGVQTIVEKRATFACTPALQRPPMQIAPGLLACGDYVEGPYPATLEGAVRSGMAAAQALSNGTNMAAFT
jgi:hydroxysqualene dehydroxylase